MNGNGEIQDFLGFGELADGDFQKLRDFIYKHFGINILPKKKYLLQSRLIKRIKALNLSGYKEYVQYVFHENNGDEVYQMLSVVSTNKTDFFREKAHFDFIENTVVPACNQTKRLNLKVWSAGCSSGQEAYSLAMLFAEEKQKGAINDFVIYGNDISVKILKMAVKAVYPYHQVKGIPEKYRNRYLLKSKDIAEHKIRIVPEIRKKTKFVWLNLVDTTYNLPHDFDIILCRNTLIYFDRVTQEKVVNRLIKHLRPNGYFIIGHSESLINMKYNHLTSVFPTVFQKTNYNERDK